MTTFYNCSSPHVNMDNNSSFHSQRDKQVDSFPTFSATLSNTASIRKVSPIYSSSLQTAVSKCFSIVDSPIITTSMTSKKFLLRPSPRSLSSKSTLSFDTAEHDFVLQANNPISSIFSTRTKKSAFFIPRPRQRERLCRDEEGFENVTHCDHHHDDGLHSIYDIPVVPIDVCPSPSECQNKSVISDQGYRTPVSTPKNMEVSQATRPPPMKRSRYNINEGSSSGETGDCETDKAEILSGQVASRRTISCLEAIMRNDDSEECGFFLSVPNIGVGAPTSCLPLLLQEEDEEVNTFESPAAQAKRCSYQISEGPQKKKLRSIFLKPRFSMM